MRVNLRQLAAFKAIAEQGGYRKAAEFLNVSQPTLTATIKSLEEEIGAAVLDRTTRTVKMTAAGQELYAHLGHLFDQLHQAVVSTRDVAAGRGGLISLTYIDFAMLGNLPEILMKYHEVNPKVRVNIAFASSREQIEQVHGGRTDLGFIMQGKTPLPKGIANRPILREGLVAVLHPDHRFAARDGLELAELAKEDFVMGGPMWASYNDLITNLCIKRGFLPRTRQTAHLREELLSFVMAGLGILIYPECILNTTRFGLAVVPLRDVGHVVSTSAIWRENSTNPVLPSLLQKIDDLA